MSSDSQDKKGSLDLTDTWKEEEARSKRVGGHRPHARKLRSINPLGMRVLVRVRPEANVTDGGLYLPEGAKQTMQESLIAEVVEVASALDADSDEETNISGVPLGAVVLIPKKAGITVPWDDNLRIVETKEVLAIVVETEIL
ncbi:MAG: co-chaperone GroES family protein [Bdellovibrionota bacterium]